MPRNTAELLAKLAALTPPATALTDSEFLPVEGATAEAELVVTDQGRFISSPVDGWILHRFDPGA